MADPKHSITIADVIIKINGKDAENVHELIIEYRRPNMRGKSRDTASFTCNGKVDFGAVIAIQAKGQIIFCGNVSGVNTVLGTDDKIENIVQCIADDND